MGITINLKIPCNTIHSPTNKEKPPKITIDSKRVALRYDDIGIVVLRPHIDRLTFGFSPTKAFLQQYDTTITPDEYKKHVKAALWHEAEVNSKPYGLSHVTGVPFMKQPWKNYNVNMRYKPPSSTESVLIQLAPKAEGSNLVFIRFDMNPARFTREALSEIRSFIEEALLILPGAVIPFEDFIGWCPVFRADVAVDILGARPYDLEIRSQKGKKPILAKSQTYNSATGRMETIYPKLKKTGSDNDQLYDKRKERIDAGKEPIYGDFLHCRYECRIQKTTFDKLANIKNRCNRISVRALNLRKVAKMKHTDHLFIRYALDRTLDKALKIIPLKYQAKYKNAYDGAMHPIWNPDKIWSYWKDAANYSALFPEK